MKRMIDDKEYNDLKETVADVDNNSYSITIEDNSLIVTKKGADSNEDNV